MAEAFLREFYGNRYKVYNAGIEPIGINPYAIRIMKEIGIYISKQKSKSLNKFAGEEFDYVVTTCGDADEVCPVFPLGVERIHNSFDDPTIAKGTEEEILSEFRRVRDEIRKWVIETFGSHEECFRYSYSINYSGHCRTRR